MRSCVILAAVLTGSVFAGPVAWTLVDATFSDGGVATGYFVLDADTKTISTWDIRATGGFILFPFEFTPSNSFSLFDPGAFGALFDSFALFPNNLPPPLNFEEVLSLRIPTVSPLTNAGGTIGIDLGNVFQGECLNCAPYRSFVSGSVTSVPEPGSAAGVPIAIVVLASASRLRLWAKRRPEQRSTFDFGRPSLSPQ